MGGAARVGTRKLTGGGGDLWECPYGRKRKSMLVSWRLWFWLGYQVVVCVCSLVCYGDELRWVPESQSPNGLLTIVHRAVPWPGVVSSDLAYCEIRGGEGSHTPTSPPICMYFHC